MNPDEPSEISPTEKPSVQSHTPGEVFNLVLAAQNGSADACIELSRCLDYGDGVPENPVAACAWLLLATANGSEVAGVDLLQLRSRLSPEEVEEAQMLAEEYSEDSYADFNQVLADKLARQEGQKLTAEELLVLLIRADADDEEAVRILGPILDDLKEKMPVEEMKMFEQQVFAALIAHNTESI